MQQSWVDETQRNAIPDISTLFSLKHPRHSPTEAPYKTDELVQVIRTGPTDHGATEYYERTEAVLLPFDPGVEFTAPGPERILHNAKSWEELKGRGEKDGKRVQELDDLNEFLVLGEVDDHDCLNLGTISCVRESPGASKKD